MCIPKRNHRVMARSLSSGRASRGAGGARPGDDKARGIWRQRRSVNANGLKLLAPGVGDSRFTRVGEHHRRAVRGMQDEQLYAGRYLRRLRKQAGDVFGADRLHVSEAAVTEMRERVLRDLRISGGFDHMFVGGHGPRLLLYELPVESCYSFRHSSCSEIAIVLTIRSGSGRARSIDSNPFLRSALKTSMPSASTKVRWNWRAAMPRWRYCRLLSSCCRPRITNWLSSIVTSSCSRVKPATASVMRSRSGSRSSRGTRSML